MWGLVFMIIASYVGILAASILTGLTLLERGLLGVLSGFLIAMWSTFLIFLVTKNLVLSFWVAFLVCGALSVIFTYVNGVTMPAIKRVCRAIVNSARNSKPLWVFFIIIGLSFTWLFSSYLIQPRADGWYAGINSWGDMPLHLSLINHFRVGAGTLEYPIFNGERLTYPFLADFLAAALSGPGMVDLRLTLVGIGSMLAFMLVLAIYAFAMRAVNRKSVAILTIILFFIGSGVGFAYYVKDSLENNSFEVTKDYAHKGDINLNWGSVILDYMLPQRTFMTGFPIGVMIIVLFLAYLGAGRSAQRSRYLLYGGVMAGMLGMVHTHTLLSVGVVGGILALLFFSWRWLWFFIPSGILALPQVLWIRSRVVESFIRVHYGWTSQAASLGQLVVFWLRNTWLVLILGIIGTFFVEKKLRKLAVPFWALFVLGNVMIFQPWDFDNMKFMLFWWLYMALLGSVFLVHLEKKGVFGKVAFTGLLALAILSGVLALYLGATARFHMFSPEELELGKWIADNTPRDAIFMTSDHHNNLVPSIGGRRILMGFGGWLWSHGIKTGSRGDDIKRMFTGDPETKELLNKYGVDYAVIGPAERNDKKANESFYQKEFKQVHETEKYKVFEV